MLSNNSHLRYGNRQILIQEPLQKKVVTEPTVFGESSEAQSPGCPEQESNAHAIEELILIKKKTSEAKQVSEINSHRKMKSESLSFRIHSIGSARRPLGAVKESSSVTKFGA